MCVCVGVFPPTSTHTQSTPHPPTKYTHPQNTHTENESGSIIPPAGLCGPRGRAAWSACSNASACNTAEATALMTASRPTAASATAVMAGGMLISRRRGSTMRPGRSTVKSLRRNAWGGGGGNGLVDGQVYVKSRWWLIVHMHTTTTTTMKTCTQHSHNIYNQHNYYYHYHTCNTGIRIRRTVLYGFSCTLMVGGPTKARLMVPR